MTVPASGARASECAWCGAPLDHGRGEQLTGRIRCRRCGAATTDPWPDSETLASAYGEWYRPRQQRRFGFAGDALLGRTRSTLASRLDRIAPPGPILDVGAGDGVLLDALEAKGRQATGLERAGEREDLRDDPIERVEGDGNWAAVIFWHSLEHLPRPGSAVREAARLLRPGGVLAIATPNNASLQARVFGDDWLHLDLPRHLVHLSAAGLRVGIEGAGMRVERVSHVRGGQVVIGWLQGLVGALPGRLDLYQSLRRPAARITPIDGRRRLAAILAGVALFPVALAASVLEVVCRRGGTVYVEARRV